MFKLLRQKIQSLSETQQNILTVILILFNIVIIIFWINFWASLPKTIPKIEGKPKQTEEIPEPFKKGEVGEISEKEVEEKGILPMPLVIFNTSGKILEVKSDRLIVQGDGSNFVDQKPRELNVIFIESTTTLEPGQKVRYQGFTGLKYLKPGMEIAIEGAENIRGKTEFEASIINIF